MTRGNFIGTLRVQIIDAKDLPTTRRPTLVKRVGGNDYKMIKDHIVCNPQIEVAVRCWPDMDPTTKKTQPVLRSTCPIYHERLDFEVSWPYQEPPPCHP